ncbi:MAG: hypothetical protein M1817_006074 [Caeruleum heppii]|nr:MAG: hypothetical protein M1817_006074 [Caeruleum heppii]
MSTDVAKLVSFRQLPEQQRRAVLASVKRLEKKAFPAQESLDFDMELRKLNTHLLCVVQMDATDIKVMAYLVYARIKQQASLHKVCVAEGHRRRGLATTMLTTMQRDLQRQNCRTIHLWVDEARETARRLYESCGYRPVERVADYYSPNRHGLKMVLQLNDG